MPPALTRARFKSFLRRPPVVISLLSIAAVLAFLAVTHLVNRFREQEKALARHLYAQGQAEMNSGKPDRAIGYFRAALTYNRNDFEYQLNLARALRDTGRTDESKSYLMSLWERAPEDGAVNLALGRLAAREVLTDEAIHYYHNASYGIWNTDPETHRRNAQFELIDFLLRRNARPQAEAELITLAASLPGNSAVETRVSQTFASLGDYEHALSEYQTVLEHDRENAAAATGAGEAAFQLHRYRTAENYLETALKLDPRNSDAERQLQTAKMIMQIDPFLRGISTTERNRRIQVAFDRAGKRLNECAKLKGLDQEPTSGNSADIANPPPSSPDLASLQENWAALRTRFARRGAAAASDATETRMDVVFQIEQQTEKECGEPVGLDEALLLLAQDRDGVNQ